MLALCLASLWPVAHFGVAHSGVADSGSSTLADVQQIRIDLHGLSKDLREQLNNYIDKPPQLQADDIPAYVENLKKNAIEVLHANGYYNSEIDADYASYKTDTTVVLTIDVGAPVRIDSIAINLNEDAAKQRDFRQTLRQLSLTKGEVFRHDSYEKAKSALLKTAQLLGYFDARYTRSQVLITKADNTAKIFLDLDTATRYTINQVIYNQDLYPQEFVSRWQNFETSVPYRANYITDLTVNLQNSGYFKQVRVVPDLQLAVDHNVPLIVDLEPENENSVGLGLGYATDSGPRFKTNWLRPHTNRHGHALESNTSVSRLRQDLSLSYRIPHKRFPANNHYSIDAGILNHATDDTFSQLRTLEFGEHRLTKNKWRRTFFLRYENERFKVGDDKNTIDLVLPGASLSRVVSKGGINPEKGKYFSFQLMAAHRSLLSDINMLRATAAGKILNSWQKKHYLIARAELGALRTQSLDRVPTTHRFFAGGDNSVRGFSYQEISPRNTEGESTGGQFLTTASLEYNRYFNSKFALAAFVDTGRAFINKDDAIRTGVGLGLRWRSPVGPLRIDIARGLDNEDSPYRLHLAIGPEL